MTWLISGLALWALIHLFAAVAPAARAGLTGAMGEKGSKGVIALGILAGLVLIVVGWRSILPYTVYIPPTWGDEAALVLMFAAVFLFGAAHGKSNIKRFVRHPQLTGVIVWSIAHLLANGDNRSLVLFGTLGAWALIEIPLINRRESAWVKPDPSSFRTEVIGVVITVVVFVVLIALHPYYAGARATPY